MRFERIRIAPDESPKGEHWRQRIAYDDDWGLTLVAEERTSSNKKAANVVEATTIELSLDALKWFRDQASELLAKWERTNGCLQPVHLRVVPQNDVDRAEALELVAKDAKAALAECLRDGTTSEDWASAIGHMQESIGILKKTEGRLVSVETKAAPR